MKKKADRLAAKWLKRMPNVPRFICDHVIGTGHSTKHRIICGVFMGFCGIALAKEGLAAIPHELHVFSFKWLNVILMVMLHLSIDFVGYGIHGLGLVPLFEHLQSTTNTETETE
jgi:hypothetical protein